MISFSSNPAELTETLSLLQILADPVKAKAILDDIITRSADLTALSETVSKAQQTAEATERRIAKAAAEIDANKRSLEDKYTLRENAVANRESAVSIREDTVAAQIIAVKDYASKTEADLNSRIDAVSARELSVSSREAEVSKAEALSASIKDEYENKLKALKAAVL